MTTARCAARITGHSETPDPHPVRVRIGRQAIAVRSRSRPGACVTSAN